MFENLMFFYNRTQEKLWVKPAIVCFWSIAAALVAQAADNTPLVDFVPEVSTESIKNMLLIMGSSMLSIATFAVSSMVSAYSSAGNVATPRTFRLVIADDNSQNALSAFVGAFIFSIVSLVALLNDFFGIAGRFFLFVATITIFALVVVMFVRWVDSVARLGRLGSIIGKVEDAAEQAFKYHRDNPHQGGLAPIKLPENAQPLHAKKIGYIQHINMSKLNSVAKDLDLRIQICALQGTFLDPSVPFAHIVTDDITLDEAQIGRFEQALTIGSERVYDRDPRFGMIVLSEIASRALSAAVNDPGTAISIIGSQIRLITAWKAPLDNREQTENDMMHSNPGSSDSNFDEPNTGVTNGELSGMKARHANLHMPAIEPNDIFIDSFARIARDGASVVEVLVRVQKALRGLSYSHDSDIRHAAKRLGATVLSRADEGLTLDYEKDTIRKLSDFCAQADELS